MEKNVYKFIHLTDNDIRAGVVMLSNLWGISGAVGNVYDLLRVLKEEQERAKLNAKELKEIFDKQ